MFALFTLKVRIAKFGFLDVLQGRDLGNQLSLESRINSALILLF